MSRSISEPQPISSSAPVNTDTLAEAILVRNLKESCTQRKGAWWLAERRRIQEKLPFWDLARLQGMLRSLVEKGVIQLDSPLLEETECLVFSINESRLPLITAPSHPEILGNQPIAAGWLPSEDRLRWLWMSQGIPFDFALGQVQGFVALWRKTGTSSRDWEEKFRNWVRSEWRRAHPGADDLPFLTSPTASTSAVRCDRDRDADFPPAHPAPPAAAGDSRRGAQQSAAERPGQPVPSFSFDKNWRPDEDAVEIMLRVGVDRKFIDDAIPGFILYWRERGGPPTALNSKFIQHVEYRWQHDRFVQAHDTEPHCIPDNWRPSGDLYDILRMEDIDAEFAERLLPEFIMYWKDRNQPLRTWNNKFLWWVKKQWAYSNSFTADSGHATQQGTHTTRSTRSRSLAEDLNDRSWAR